MEVAYVAGLFDGEGTVGVYKVTNGKSDKTFWTARGSISGTFYPVLENIRDHFEYGGVYSQKRQKKLFASKNGLLDHDLCKQGWKWQVTNSQDLKDFLISIFPYLNEKKEQCQTVLDFIDKKIDGPTAEKLCKHQKKFSYAQGSVDELPPPEGALRGSRNPFSKLTEDQVLVIKRRLADGERQVDIARSFGIGRDLVHKIKSGKSWSHVYYSNP